MQDIKFKIVLDGKEFIATADIGEAALLKIGKAAGEASRQGSRAAGEMKISWASLATGLNQSLDLLSKLRTGFESAMKPIQVAGQFEKYEASLKVMLGSAEKAKQRLKELSDFAASTPFELPEVVQAGNQLQALGRYSKETLRQLGDLASASGKPLEQVLSAYAKLVTGQKGMAVDMFRDLLITTDDWVKATNSRISSSGELQASWQEMAAALPKILKSKGFDGMMAVQAQTFEGMTSNMQDSFTRLLGALGEKMLPAAKVMIESITSLVSSLTPVKTNLEQVTEKAHDQRFAFEILVARYERLRDTTNKTANETKDYASVIDQLKKAFPDYLGKLDLQRGKLLEVAAAFGKIREQMVNNLIVEREGAKRADLVKDAADLMEKTKQWEKIRDENQAKMDNGEGDVLVAKVIEGADRELEKLKIQFQANNFLIDHQTEKINKLKVSYKELFPEAVKANAAISSGFTIKTGSSDTGSDSTKPAPTGNIIIVNPKPDKKEPDYKNTDDLSNTDIYKQARKIQQRYDDEAAQTKAIEQDAFAAAVRIGDAFGNEITRGLFGAKMNFGRLLKQMAQMVVASGISSVFAGLINLATGGAGGFGKGWLSHFVRGFAHGGEVNKPELILAGENEPEIIAPKRNFQQVIRDIITDMSSGTSPVRIPSRIAASGSSSSSFSNQELIQEIRYMHATLKEKENVAIFSGDLKDDKIFERQKITKGQRARREM